MTTPDDRDARFLDRLASLEREPSQILPALRIAQHELAHVPAAAIAAIAAHARVPASHVDSVTWGYPELRRQPAPSRIVRVCHGAACLCGAGRQLRRSLEDLIDGDSTIGIETATCLFACAHAPVIEIDGRLIGRCDAAAAKVALATAPRTEMAE